MRDIMNYEQASCIYCRDICTKCADCDQLAQSCKKTPLIINKFVDNGKRAIFKCLNFRPIK